MMKSLSSVGLGLSIVFCCLLLALVAEVYYLLWWKKRITNREIETNYGNPVKELFYMFCLKRPSSESTSSSMRNSSDSLVHDPESQIGINKEFLFKPFGEDHNMMRQQQQEQLGPPRFLFTIVEESKEDLESEDGKSRCDNNNNNTKSVKGDSRGGRSLGDLLVVETPYLTPNASPQFFTPPFTPMDITNSNISSPYNQHNHHGFNPLFESSTDAEFNRMKSSPPPKFKFLQEAEEKLRRKLQEDDHNDGSSNSMVTIVVDKKTLVPQYHSSSSQVLPLAS